MGSIDGMPIEYNFLAPSELYYEVRINANICDRVRTSVIECKQNCEAPTDEIS